MNYKNIKTIAQNNAVGILLAETTFKNAPCEVVIKTVIPKINDKIYAQLYLAKQLHHSKILEMIDFGKCTFHSENKNYVTYIYTPGIALSKILQVFSIRNLAVPVPLILDITTSICDILNYSHNFFKSSQDEFIAHGNLSPGFILITSNGKISLSDMGIGDIVSHSFDGYSIVENDVNQFTHPDITRGKACKRKHEIYSLGKILLFMLEGNCSPGNDGLIDPTADKKSGNKIADRMYLKKIARHLLTNPNTTIQEIKNMLNCFTRNYNIKFNSEITAQMLHTLLFNVQLSENQSNAALPKEGWIPRDFVIGQPDYFSGNLSQNDNSITDYKTETDSFTLSAKDLHTISDACLLPGSHEEPVYQPLKPQFSDPQYTCGFSQLLKRENNPYQPGQNPFTNVLKKEDIWPL